MTDSSLKTYAKIDGTLPQTVEFKSPFPVVVRAFRLIWRDCGMKDRRRFDVGAYGYRAEWRDGDAWRPLVDASANEADLLVDYRETPRVLADELRIVVLSAPNGVTPGITEFTVFTE